MTTKPLQQIISMPGFGVMFHPSGRIFLLLDPVREVSIEELRLPSQLKNVPSPFIAGFITYEYAHKIESLHRTLTDSYKLPIYRLYEYARVIEIKDGKCSEIDLPKGSTPLWKITEDEVSFLVESLLKNPGNERNILSSPPSFSDLCKRTSNFTQDSYEGSVEKIRMEIAKGNVYQVNLSQQIKIPGIFDGWRLFLDLASIEQGSRSAFISVGDPKSPKHIISNSPELFFEVTGKTINTSPIKGTISRAPASEQDEIQRSTLLGSLKDRAELAMIVDLMRNDLGKFAVPGSVKVESFPVLFSLNKIHHLCAPITAEIPSDVNFKEILHALFPSGSITGAPKIAAMNIISELEKTARGIYCGSIGWTHGNTSSWNVAIRTGIVTEETCIFQAGGGVTFDSNPRSEYEETLDKAASFLQAILLQTP